MVTSSFGTKNAVGDTMPASPGDRGWQELLCQPGRHRPHLSSVTSDTGAPTLENRGAEPTEPLLGKCHPATGQLQPQDRFLLLLFICKAPRKETRWFVHTELWLLLVTELGCNCAKASGHSSFLKGHPRNPSHISPGFYGVLSSSGH